MSSQARERTVETSRAVSPGLAGDAFPAEALQGVYQAIYQRRDIRSFRSDPFPDDVLARLLNAAHHAPSVGFMQPWSFLLVRDGETRTQVKALFDRERQAAACFFDEPRRSQYLSFKLEGILDAPLNICVTCDPTAAGPTVIGRNSIPETDVYSTCCAVENLWLAARAEGIGVGWVSIIKLPATARDPGHPAAYHTGRLSLSRLSQRRLSGATRAADNGLASAHAAWRRVALRALGHCRASHMAGTRPPPAQRSDDS